MVMLLTEAAPLTGHQVYIIYYVLKVAALEHLCFQFFSLPGVVALGRLNNTFGNCEARVAL